MCIYIKAGRTESGALYLAIIFRRNGLVHSGLFFSPHALPMYVRTSEGD